MSEPLTENPNTEEEEPESLAVNGEQEAPKNLLDQIRQRRRELTESRQTYVSIPGYDDIGLCAKYHLLDGKEMDIIGEKVRRQTRDRVERGIWAAVDTMVAACDGLYIEQGGEYTPLDPYDRGVPLTYEKALAEFADFEAESARQVVMGLFGHNDAAISWHSYKLQRWFQNTFQDTDEEFLGEF